jgi:hypothetical protein
MRQSKAPVNPVWNVGWREAFAGSFATGESE